MELQKLDEKVLSGAAAAAAAGPGGRTTNSKTEKAKKDNFKRLTTQVTLNYFLSFSVSLLKEVQSLTVD